MKDFNLDGFGEVRGILEADEPVALGLVTPLVSHHWSEFSRSHNQLKFGPIILDPNLQKTTRNRSLSLTQVRKCGVGFGFDQTFRFGSAKQNSLREQLLAIKLNFTF